jgi:hypothetical protein
VPSVRFGFLRREANTEQTRQADRRALSHTDATIAAEIAPVKLPCALAIALLVGDVASASEVPMPRPRPGEQVAAPAIDPATAAWPPPEPSACQIKIAGEIAAIAPLRDIRGPGDCGALDVVRLEAIILKDRTRIPLTPPATLRCKMAEAVAHWVREDVSSAVTALGAALRAIDNYDSYQCRGRNRVFGAKTSEHGLANALDVRGLRLANGDFADLTDRSLMKDFRENVRRSACARFTTVLGPGSDGFHESHIHLDLAERSRGFRMCQWDVLEPLPDIPLPQPRPKEAPQSEE